MAKGDGVLFVVLGLVAVIASLFFPFINNGAPFQGSSQLSYVFQNFGAYLDALQNIGTFFDVSIWIGLVILYSIIFLIACLLVLVGLNSSTSQTGGYLLMIHPIAYLILEVLLPVANGGNLNTLFGTLKIGFFLQFVGALFIIIGAMRNKSPY
jgi:hypothetical protein